MFLVPCQLGYSSICKSAYSNEEKTAICPATNMVNIAKTKPLFKQTPNSNQAKKKHEFMGFQVNFIQM